MVALPLLAVAVGFVMRLVAVLFVLSALALVFIILLQKGKGGGLSSAFGGGSATGLLGSKTGDVLTWVTITLVGVFLILGVVMAKYYKPKTGQYGAQTKQTSTPQTANDVTPSTPVPGQAEASASGPVTTVPVPDANASKP